MVSAPVWFKLGDHISPFSRVFAAANCYRFQPKTAICCRVFCLTGKYLPIFIKERQIVAD